MCNASWEEPGLLLFKKGASLDHDGSGNLHLAFAIRESDLHAWEERLAQHGVAIEKPRNWERGGHSLHFRNPDGHMVELATPRNLVYLLRPLANGGGMRSETWVRRSGVLAMLGGALWMVSWTFNAFTADGTRAVMGLSERGWRTVLNPALLFFLAGLAGLYAKQAGRMGKVGRTGFFIGVVGLMTTIVGNVAEFWILEPADHRGWHIFLTGLVILGTGSLLFGLAALRVGILPRLGTWLLTLWFPMGLLGLLLRALGLPSWVEFLAGAGFFLFLGLSWILLGYAIWSEKNERHPEKVPEASPPQ